MSIFVTKLKQGDHLARVTGTTPTEAYIEHGPLELLSHVSRTCVWAPLDAVECPPAGSTVALFRDDRLTLHPSISYRT